MLFEIYAGYQWWKWGWLGFHWDYIFTAYQDKTHIREDECEYLILQFAFLSMACRNLVSTNMGVRFRVPLQKLHPLSRAIHHRYSGNSNPQRAPHRTAARYFTSLSRLPMRSPKPPPGSGGRSYQQQRSFWVARLATRLLKLRYILLGSAVGGGYTAKKVSAEELPLKILNFLF